MLRNNTDKYDICREIKILENEVNLSNISVNDKKVFFGTSAIAKFSSIYWTEVEEDEEAGEFWTDNDKSEIIYAVGPITKAAVDAAVYVGYVVNTGGFWTGFGVASAASRSFETMYNGLQAAIAGWISLPDLP